VDPASVMPTGQGRHVTHVRWDIMDQLALHVRHLPRAMETVYVTQQDSVNVILDSNCHSVHLVLLIITIILRARIVLQVQHVLGEEAVLVQAHVRVLHSLLGLIVVHVIHIIMDLVV
jgi:hypothetical protein